MPPEDKAIAWFIEQYETKQGGIFNIPSTSRIRRN